ncbi:MAG: hypothetical protein ACTMIK_11240 [Galactobacter sp.]
MRIRNTKPEFWKSRRIASVSWDARLILKGLESYVDDNGVGVDDIELIVTQVFPRDMFENHRETVARVSEGISELHQAGLVWRYTSETDSLLYVSFWEQSQRIDKPGKGRNPRPDGTFDYKASEIRESVANTPEVVAPVTGEQGNRGTEVPPTAGDPVAAARTHLAVIDSPEPDTSEPTAQTLIAEWLDHQSGGRPPARVIGKLSKAIKELIDEGQPYDQIRAAVQAWDRKGLDASLLGSVLHELRNKQPTGTAQQRSLQAGADLVARVANRPPAKSMMEIF